MKKFFYFLSVITVIVLISCGNSNVTKENYEKLKTNMTTEQVIEILGNADTKTEGDMGDFGIIELWHFQSGDKAIVVTFENGKVMDKSWIEI